MFDRDPLQMALDEAASHGASQRDLDLLREQFRQMVDSNNKSNQSEIPEA